MKSLSRRDFLKMAGIAGATISAGAGLGGLIAACGSGTTTTTAATTASTTATTAGTATTAAATTSSEATATTAGPTTTVSAAPQTLKIGMVYDNSFPLHVQWKAEMDALIPDLNSKGGLAAGDGNKYQIDVIAYDGKRDAETSRSAVQRLISQDKVSFILGDESTDYWQPLTEAAKILVACATPSPAVLKPEYKYTFQSSYLNTQPNSVWGWIADSTPFKTVCAAHPDNLQGHAEGDHTKQLAAIYGQQVLKEVFYPGNTTDFSAIATTLVNTGADIFTTCAGGPVSDAQLYRAMHQAGFKGFYLAYISWSIGQGSLVVTPDNFEKITTVVQDTDNPTPPSTAKELIDVYTAKYGKWDFPASFHVLDWYLLKAALEKATSLDVDAVAAAIEAPLEYDTPTGHCKMIPRPDLGNSRVCDTLWQSQMATITNGKYDMKHLITLDEAYAYSKKAYKWA